MQSRFGFVLVLVLCLVHVCASDTASTCKTWKTCSKGGQGGVTCNIGQEVCPPCMTQDGGCFEYVSGKCQFGWTDCGPYFGVSSNSSSGAGSKSNGSATINNSNSPSPSTPGSSDGSGSTGSIKKGSDMSLVFAIIGSAIGVIAVGVIFLVLVRRSRSAADDFDENCRNTQEMGYRNNYHHKPAPYSAHQLTDLQTSGEYSASGSGRPVARQARAAARPRVNSNTTASSTQSGSSVVAEREGAYQHPPAQVHVPPPAMVAEQRKRLHPQERESFEF